MVSILLPELGDGITKATVACWHAKPGDFVKAGEDIVEVVTDKATFSVEAPMSGRLAAIMVNEGKESPVGSVLGTIQTV